MRERVLVWTMILALLAVMACGTDSEPGAPSSPRDPSVASVVGEWTANSEWETVLSFSSDGLFRKTDLIAPCPADTECVWSGIVVNTGTWTLRATAIDLTYSAPDTFAGATTPAALELQVVGGNVSALIEARDEGPTLVYSRP